MATNQIAYRYSTDFLKSQIKRLAANYGSRKFSEQEARETEANFSEVIREVGERRFAAGVTETIRKHPAYFPTVAEFREYIPPPTPDELIGVGVGVRCPKCRDTDGFLLVKRPHPLIDGRTHAVAMRCKHE